jgi:hypothetical protein
MRQGNGAEILGANDPRGVTIGMIYVAPNDDRESVLAAILTQEKLGRKQIAVVLPAQNKAFQRPIDFEGLKNMRRKLQAQLIIIAPPGPGPAEFARQRSFKVYSTVENYVKSLQDDYLTTKSPQRGWFARKKAKMQSAESVSAGEEHSSVQPIPVVLPPADVSMAPNSNIHTRSEHLEQVRQAESENANSGKSFQPIPVPVNTSDEDDITQPTLPQPVEDQDALLPPHEISSSSAQPIENKPTQDMPYHNDVEEDALSTLSSSTQSGTEPGIIELSARRKRKTGPMPIPVVLPGATVEPIVPVDNSSWHQDNAAVPGAAAAAGASGSMGNRASGGRNVPPTRTRVGRMPPPSGSSSQRRRRLFIVVPVILLVLTVLLCSTLALAAPNTVNTIVGKFNGGNLAHVLTGTPAATVTLVPKTMQIANTYEISAVTGTPGSSQRQVQARKLSYTTTTQNKTVNATGVKQTPAVAATGSLTFYNALSTSQTVSSGTVFNVGNGIQIENTSAANIPAAHAPTEGSVTVSARAVAGGSSGNIGALTLNQNSCCGTGITVSNTSGFSGGQDPQNYTVVAQSDVNNAATPLGNQLLQSAQNALKSQEKSGEAFASQPQCSTNVTSQPAVGAASKTVTASVSATCSGEVYDQSGAEGLASSLLQEQGNKNAGYVLTGNIATSQPQVISVNANTDTVLLLVKAQGNWVYQFSDAQKQNMAKSIAGKTKTQAQNILLKQTGVGVVKSIDISGGNGNTLPTDYTQITITTSSASLTPTPGTGSPPTSPIPVTPGTGTPSGPALTPTSGRG